MTQWLASGEARKRVGVVTLATPGVRSRGSGQAYQAASSAGLWREGGRAGGTEPGAWWVRGVRNRAQPKGCDGQSGGGGRAWSLLDWALDLDLHYL